MTGASGFVGNHLLHGLIRDGFQVSGVCHKNSIGSLITPRDGEFASIQADLSVNIDSLPGRVDAIVHAAARLGGEGVTTNQLIRGNVEATRNLLAYARASGARAFIYLSSTSVYGDISSSVLDRSTPIVSPGEYGKSKYLGEQLIEERSNEIPSLSFRLPGVIGRGAHRNFIATMLEKIQSGQTVRIFNPQTLFNNVVHVADLVGLVSNVLHQGCSGYDVMPLGAGSQLTIGKIPKVLMQAAGKKVPVETVFEPMKPAYIIDNSHATNRYNYRPIALNSMLKNFVKENS